MKKQKLCWTKYTSLKQFKDIDVEEPLSPEKCLLYTTGLLSLVLLAIVAVVVGLSL